MSESCNHKNPLQHGGTTQSERIVPALDPSNVELHGLSERDWLKFSAEYARLVNYYKEDDPEKPAGDWQSFFPSENEIDNLLSRADSGDVEPHMALFVTFLKLLTYSQKHLNELPKRHLDFYYKKILQIREKPMKPDHVHVLFELAKNASEEFIEPGTALSAGKDSEGNSMTYETVTPLVVNRARVASIKSVYVDRDEGPEVLRHAPMAKSVDGVEEELEVGKDWSAFGNHVWPNAELAFYIASDLLWLKEGSRKIALKFKLNEPLTLSKSHLKAFVTGEKEWMEVSGIEIDTKSRLYNFIVTLTVNPDTDAVTAYKEEVHEAGLSTAKPALKVIFTEATDYEKLKRADFGELNLQVDVEGVTALELKNELGNIDPEKPFMPFGSRPKVGSKLSIKYPELSQKPVSNLRFEMQWLNTPANFSMHYSHYQEAIRDLKNQNSLNADNLGTYLPSSVITNYMIVYDETMFQSQPSSHFIKGNRVPEDTMKSTFRAGFISSYINEAESFQLFSNTPQVLSSTLSGTKKVSDPNITFTLYESFYHELYSKIYTNAVLEADTGKAANLPNEPYTPLLDSLKMSYTARENVKFTSDEGATSVMFHQHPFGVKRSTGNSALLPDYSFNELYIGLKDMSPGSNISLLFQVAEGTEDPMQSVFEEGDTDWWFLSDNTWIELTNEDFARDQTNHFLTSGIVELSLPKSANSTNSLLPEDLHWLRVRLKKSHYAVCRFIDIHAQAAEAVFQHQGNSLQHLKNGLISESIGKMTAARAGVKSVKQPYSGFKGLPAEQDSSYYKRVSERLRHKNRAVSIWDYEHLVLEQFPSLYKAKCLNHCYWDGYQLDEMSPGNVTMVLIPKLSEDNTNFRMEPRVSRNFMDEVEAFLNNQNSKHASLKAANAVYEPVRFEFRVEFKDGLDFNFHKKRIVEDLKRMVAPWVFDEDAAIEFGGSFSEYEVVHYIENLSYVDYITNFKMFHKPAGGGYSQKPLVEPSVPLAILVPVFDEKKIEKAQGCD